jgi:GNAT superfamily N-acetyltransferase
MTLRSRLDGRAAQAFRYCGLAAGHQHLPYGEIVTSAEITVDGYRIDPLTPQTWPAFAALAERHNGVFGGCWCVWFHCHPDPPERQEMGNRAFKQRMTEEGRAHAALVFDGDEAIAWAEYGTVDELPNIHHRKEWEQTVEQVPDFRITCLFVDRRYRRNGLAEVAVRGALALIAAAGGGRVESYPHDLPPDKKISSSFLYNATRTMYERLGFSYERPKGKGNCVMSLTVPPT